MNNFEFVSFDGPCDISSGEKREAVRAFVVRRFHQNRRTTQTKRVRELLESTAIVRSNSLPFAPTSTSNPCTHLTENPKNRLPLDQIKASSRRRNAASFAHGDLALLTAGPGLPLQTSRQSVFSGHNSHFAISRRMLFIRYKSYCPDA